MRVRAAENGNLDAAVIVDPFDTPIAVTRPIGKDLGRLSHSELQQPIIQLRPITRLPPPKPQGSAAGQSQKWRR
jgi:hypothetical protein